MRREGDPHQGRPRPCGPAQADRGAAFFRSRRVGASTNLSRSTTESAAPPAAVQPDPRPFMTEEEWIDKYVHDAPRLTPEQVRDLLAIAGHRLAPAV
jgi:hypothetical protein